MTWFGTVTLADEEAGGTGMPGGGEIVAVFVADPAEAVNVPVSVNVTVPPDGNVAIVMPAPCSAATVTLPGAGHTAPPDAGPHVTPEIVKPATAGSVSTELLAELGPLFVATTVNVTGLPGSNVLELTLLLIV